MDQDCDGGEICYLDGDNDGFRPDSGATYVSSDEDCADEYEAALSDPAGDCDDSDPNVYPGAPAVPGNGIDEDCSAWADGDKIVFDLCSGNDNIWLKEAGLPPRQMTDPGGQETRPRWAPGPVHYGKIAYASDENSGNPNCKDIVLWDFVDDVRTNIIE